MTVGRRDLPGRVNVLFPVETINREVDFRITMGVKLAANGARVFVGQHDVIFGLLQNMKNGVYFGKNIFRSRFPYESLDRYRTLKHKGFILVYLDEEGGLFKGTEAEWRPKLLSHLDPQILNPGDYIFTWGEVQAKIYREENPSLNGQIKPLGHPRFDLYKERWLPYWEPDVKKIKSLYSPFILINTNFTSVAGHHLNFSDRRRERTRPSAILTWQQYQAVVVKRLIKLIGQIRKEFPELNVVIRPHPGEMIQHYKRLFEGDSKMHVIHEGPVSPWLIAMDALIHNSCTTAVEGFLAKKPVITFCPVAFNGSFRFDEVPNCFGVPCKDANEVITEIDKIRKGSNGIRSFSGELPRLLTNLSGDSFNNTSDELIRITNQLDNFGAPSPLVIRLEENRKILLSKFKGLGRIFFPKRRAYHKYAISKFYGFNNVDIVGKVERASEVVGCDVDLHKISPRLFVLQ